MLEPTQSYYAFPGGSAGAEKLVSVIQEQQAALTALSEEPQQLSRGSEP